ncbi:hypothetical protein KEM55_005609, partial [Ascosphaera atra]
MAAVDDDIFTDPFHNPSRRPTTIRTSARRVYGKKKAEAPRAVLDDQEQYMKEEKPRGTRTKTKTKTKTKTRTSRKGTSILSATSSAREEEEDSREYAESEVAVLRKGIHELNISAQEECSISDQPTSQPSTPTAAEETGGAHLEELREDRGEEYNVARDEELKDGSNSSATECESHSHSLLSSDHTSHATSEATTLVDTEPDREPIKDEQQGQPKEEPKQSPQSSPAPPKPRRLSFSGLITDPSLTAYVSPILAQAASPLASAGIQTFASWAAKTSSRFFTVVKIAEGSYGEVYQLKLRKDVLKAEAATLKSKKMVARIRSYADVIFKIVPLRAQKGAGAKKFTSVADLTSELRLMKALDLIPGFARFREVHVVQGRFPAPYQAAWDAFAKEFPEDCLNPDPRKKRSFPDGQLWAILEMDDAGAELEKKLFKGSVKGAFEVYDIFWGTCMALARGEGVMGLEHRDLHLGNVCIHRGKSRVGRLLDLPVGAGDGNAEAVEMPSGYGLSGIETSIIDFSLSRAELRGENGGNEAEVQVAWCNLDDRGIFDAIGEDEDDALLRDTYRHMRNQVYNNDPTLPPSKGELQPQIWRRENFGTNVVWLRFLVKMLLRK